MQEITNWYWDQNLQQKCITFPTRTIIHPRLDVTSKTDIHDIPKSICKMIQAKKTISRHHIRLTNSDYNYILKEIYRQGKNYFERYVKILSDNEEN